MKKWIFITGALLCFTTGFSQFIFGVQASGNLASARIQNEADFNYDRNRKVLPGGGVFAEYGLNERFAIRGGINYLENGVTLKTLVDAESNMTVKLSNRFDYLQAPITLMYNWPASRLQYFVGMGGYFGYGISGKSKATLRYTMPDGNEMATSEVLDAFRSEEEGGLGLRRSDFGLTALAGIKLQNGLFAQVGYQVGLADINKDAGASYRNNGIQLAVGYYFLRK